jgi:hypothetical protein
MYEPVMTQAIYNMHHSHLPCILAGVPDVIREGRSASSRLLHCTRTVYTDNCRFTHAPIDRLQSVHTNSNRRIFVVSWRSLPALWAKRNMSAAEY